MLYDLATIRRDTSLDHTVDSTHRLATLLNVDPAQLQGALRRVTQRTDLLSRLQSLRERSPALAGSTAVDIARAAEFDWSASFDNALGDWLNSAPLQSSTSRVLLAGSVPPDARLHLAAETGSGTIVSELVEAPYAPLEKAPADIIVALAKRHYSAVSPAQQMMQSPNWIAAQAQKARAQGVIIWLIEEDEALPWELSSQTRALHEAKIPVLTLARQRWLAETDTLSEITSFVRSLENSR